MTTALDPRLPVLVGVGQLQQHAADPATAGEALTLMVEALRRAGDDAGAARLLELVEMLVVVRGAWNYSDPGRLVAERVGARHARTGLTAEGGNTPQAAVNLLCSRIQRGELSVAAVVGGEAIYSRRKARQAGVERRVTRQSGVEPDELLGPDIPMTHPPEQERGLLAPLHFYALFESAIRAEAGEGIDEHRDRVARLLERFNAVAARNPDAWGTQRFTVEQIRDPAPDNKMASFPYTKRMCSNWFTDQAAALLICSVEVAERLGIPRERWVFPHAGTEAGDTLHVTNRAALSESPAIRYGGSEVLRLAGVGLDDLEHIDLYSCFPSAVQVAMRELGIDSARQVTVTGGMAYFGGPLSNYVTHSITTMVDLLRASPGARGLITANGGYLTKHAFGVYSTDPPETYRSAGVQAAVDGLPTVAGEDGYAGKAVVEASTVLFSDGEPSRALLACRTPSGGRAWANSTEADLLHAATTTELAGRPVDVRPDGRAEIAA